MWSVLVLVCVIDLVTVGVTVCWVFVFWLLFAKVFLFSFVLVFEFWFVWVFEFWFWFE